MTTRLTPPAADEYAPFYADYIQRAQSLDILVLLPSDEQWLRSLLSATRPTIQVKVISP